MREAERAVAERVAEDEPYPVERINQVDFDFKFDAPRILMNALPFDPFLKPNEQWPLVEPSDEMKQHFRELESESSELFSLLQQTAERADLDNYNTTVDLSEVADVCRRIHDLLETTRNGYDGNAFLRLWAMTLVSDYANFNVLEIFHKAGKLGVPYAYDNFRICMRYRIPS